MSSPNWKVLTLSIFCFSLFLAPVSPSFGGGVAQALADRLSRALEFENGGGSGPIEHKVNLGGRIDKTFQDCVHFNAANLMVRRANKRYKIVDGSRLLFDFNKHKADAQWAKSIIKHYGIDRVCFIGRGEPLPFNFFLTPGETRVNFGKYYDILIRGSAPKGRIPFPDKVSCTDFSPENLVIKQPEYKFKSYSIFDNKNQRGLFWFGDKLDNAISAAVFIKMYGFNRKCTLGEKSLGSGFKSKPTFTYLTQVKPAKLKPKTFEIVQ